MTDDEAHEAKKRNHIAKTMFNVKRRATAAGIPFELDHKYLCAIAPEYCPIFKTKILWGFGQSGTAGSSGPDSPSLDKIIPEKGYVKGNVAWLSNRANMIKSNATQDELYKVADWTHEKIKEVQNGGARPPPLGDPANTYITRPTRHRIVNDVSARERAGY
jgi:hypothetical protein